MTTEAQVTANRRNAKKSTGPRTDDGKEKASQNSIKHGLLAREAVIRGEDWEEFEIRREGLMDQLRPEGPLEAVLAARIVDLIWRLERAGRDRNEVFGALWDRHMAGRPEPQDARERGAMIGQMVLEDYLTEGVLERLLRYERRIESSLYRTLKELRTIYDRSHTPDPQLEATLARWRQEDDDAKKARIFARCEAAKAEAAAEPQAAVAAEDIATDESRETKPNDSDCGLGTGGACKAEHSPDKEVTSGAAKTSEETPCGVTTNNSDGVHSTPYASRPATPEGATRNKCAKRTQSGGAGPGEKAALRASERRNKAVKLLAEVRELCETKPIDGPGAREAALRILDCGLKNAGLEKLAGVPRRQGHLRDIHDTHGRDARGT